MRFRVFVNDRLACTAGLADLGVLTAVVTRVKRNPEKLPEGLSPEQRALSLAEEVELSVSGWDIGSVSEPGDEHVRWLTQSLQPGDSVRIEVLPPGEFDEPTAVRRESAEVLRRSKKQYFEELKKESGESGDT